MRNAFVTLWAVYIHAQAVAHQAALSMGSARQEHSSELPFPSTGDLPDPGLKPVPPALAGGFFTAEPRKALCLSVCVYVSVCMHLFISTSFCVTAAVHFHASSLSNQSPNAGHLDCFWSFATAVLSWLVLYLCLSSYQRVCWIYPGHSSPKDHV